MKRIELKEILRNAQIEEYEISTVDSLNHQLETRAAMKAMAEAVKLALKMAAEQVATYTCTETGEKLEDYEYTNDILNVINRIKY